MTDPRIDALCLPLDQLPDPLPIPSLARGRQGNFAIEVRPPGSKSLTNRALLLAALADGTSELRDALVDADDARRMLSALQALGAKIVEHERGRITVDGVAGRWKLGPEGAELNLNNAGTATRFLAAASLLSPAPVTIDGNARMRERPIGELGDILQQLGADVEYAGKSGYPPMRVTPSEIGTARTLDIPTTRSSQFVSALLLAGPWLRGGLTVKLTGTVTSRSYVEMTVGLLSRLGANVRTSEDMRVIRVGPTQTASGEQGLRGFVYDVEPDASGATYFWAAAALVPLAACKVMGLDEHSLQGDADFPDALARMGVQVHRHTGQSAAESFVETRGPRQLSAIMADLSDMPDATMTLAVAAAFARGMSIFRGIGTLRVKETDRVQALKNELAKVGVKVESPVAGDPEVMSISPPPGGIDCSPDVPRVEFDTYDDHRMAMSMALIGLVRPNVYIRDPKCVNKTYASYFTDFAKMLG